jgi:pantoate--beta-alanine ligase
MPRLVHTVAEWRALREAHRASGRTIGFVPTLGALHPGHGSLFAAAARDNDVVLASVFVNPTQFDDPKDFDAYPRTLDTDLALMDASGVTVALVPETHEIYPDDRRYFVRETKVSSLMEGAHRPGHFDGMLTVVLKLLQIAGADRAYFGEKDHQQLELIRGMVHAFFIPTEIVACPTIREADGLAMSSRNARLTPEQRAIAPAFHRVLVSAADTNAARAELEAAGFSVDYVEDRDGRRYGAVRLGNTRLIDNVAR